MRALKGKGGEAFSIPLPPLEDRPNKDTIASLSRWQLVIPNAHPVWSRFVLMCASLADFPGVPPAKKHFPEATHEITVFAIEPFFPDDKWQAGGISVLEPVNHVWQFCSTDAIAEELMEFLAQELIDVRLFVEPSGIRGARDMFNQACRHWLAGRSARENDPKPVSE